MTRLHRSFHRMIWLAVAIVVGIAFATALILRPPPAHGAPVAAQEHAR